MPHLVASTLDVQTVTTSLVWRFNFGGAVGARLLTT